MVTHHYFLIHLLSAGVYISESSMLPLIIQLILQREKNPCNPPSAQKDLLMWKQPATDFSFGILHCSCHHAVLILLRFPWDTSENRNKLWTLTSPITHLIGDFSNRRQGLHRFFLTYKQKVCWTRGWWKWGSPSVSISSSAKCRCSPL